MTHRSNASCDRLLLVLATVLLFVVSADAWLHLTVIDADVNDDESHLGFIQWNGDDTSRGPRWITRNVIDGRPIPICSTDFPIAATAAAERWNTALGITAFAMSMDCNTGIDLSPGGWDPVAGVARLTVSRGIDSGGNTFRGKILTKIVCSGLACVGFDEMERGTPGNSMWKTYHGRAEIVVVPSRPADSLHPELVRDITHEMGHVLALADYFCYDPTDDDNVARIEDHPDRLDPPNRTIINRLPDVGGCNSVDGRPTQLDRDDYRTVYLHAKVVDAMGSAEQQTVTLT